MDDDFLHDLFRGFGPVTIRRMFGGKGIMADGIMIALVAFETLYIKADAETEPRFREAGSVPFAYRRATRAVTVPAFWSLPDAALDDTEAATAWARLGQAAALRAAARRAKPKSAGPKRRAKPPGSQAPAALPDDLGVAFAPTRRPTGRR